jgi:hypothetical protein
MQDDSPRPRLLQDVSDEELTSEGWWVDSEAVPELAFPEKAESPRLDWTTVTKTGRPRKGREPSPPKRSFKDFELEQTLKEEKRQADRAAVLEARRATRPGTPPPGDIPGVPAGLVLRTKNKFALLR